jgi:hypothetical protein
MAAFRPLGGSKWSRFKEGKIVANGVGVVFGNVNQGEGRPHRKNFGRFGINEKVVG